MTFLASIYLWLLPLVSIPIIFHLLKKRNYKDIKFSSLIFFNVIEDSTLKRNNLINILLLIIRTIILLLIILIISKPTIDGVTRNKNNSYNDVCIIILDNSFSNSMQMEQSYNKIVNKIIAVYDDNTLIKIANMSDNIFMVNNFKKNINSLNIDNQILYSTSSLENISILFDNTDYSNYNNKDFYLISDLQENIFNNKIDFIDDTWNKFLYKNDIYEGIYFSSLNIKPDFINLDESLSISIKLNNSTSKPIETSEIVLFIDDINVGFNKISIDALQAEFYTFKTSINTYGYHKCYFRYDDIKYFFVINIPPQINIAIIDENFNSKYLSNALLAFNEISGNINYSIFTLEEYRSINNTYDSVIIFGLQHLDNKLLNKISRQTNNAVAIPTESFNLNTIHEFFSLDNLSQTAKLESIKGGYINLNSSLTSDNNLKSILNNETIEFYKYYKINKTGDTVSEYENTHAFINRYVNDNLNLILITSPLDLNSNNLPLTSIFMPLINNLFIKDIKKLNYMVGDSIDPTIFSSSINLQFIENKMISNYKMKNIKSGEVVISKPGFHELVFDNTSSIISANIPLIEFSDSIANKKTLDESLKDHIMINNIDQLSDVLNTQVNGFHLWRYFLWMLILFIIIEMLISNIYVYKND